MALEENEIHVQSTPIGSTSAQQDNATTENVEEATEQAPENRPNKRRRSVAWDHFDKMSVNGKMKAKCRHCFSYLLGESKHGTKHLLDHMKSCKAMKQPNIKERYLAGNTKSELSTKVYSEKDGRDALAKMVILHEYPLSIVDHVGFRNFTRTIQPIFKCPTRNTLKSDIIKLYEEEKTHVTQSLETIQSRVAITTDMWTSSNQKKGFMAITCHFIDNEWNLQSKILRFIYVPCPHTSDALTKVLMGALMEWNLDIKLSTITVDNCTTNDSLIDKIKEKLESDKLIHDGTHIHMRCCAHILNLIVKIGLSVIKVAIENVRDSVVYWTATPKRVEKFEEACKHAKVKYTKKLGLDCQTRWNATYLMLKTALMYKKVFTRLRQLEPQYQTLPSPQDWENANEICSRLEIFYDVTAIFSGTKYPTSNLYFKKICEIRLALSNWLSSSNKIVSDMAFKMIEKFDEYWGTIHELMGVAAVFDPRYKMEMVEIYFPLVYPDDSEAQIHRIRDLCDELVKEYQKNNSHDVHTVGDSMGSSSINESGFENMSAWDRHLLSKRKTSQRAGMTELDHYLEEGIEPQANDFDILLWWKLRAAKYPTLQAIARDILAIPVSTVASESAFSASGRLISPHRSRLHPNTIEALMCAQSWLWEVINKDDGTPFTSDNYATIFEDFDTEDDS